jgi:hypothetical protein
MTTTREETGPVTSAILEKYQVLVEETVPALKKQIEELAQENKRLKLGTPKAQPIHKGRPPRRKQKR